jgi:pyridoxamine 5'-phosphate oxidase
MVANARVALLFGWLPLQRQVRVTGTAARFDDREADDYFASRPRGSQIGAWASPQSALLADRAELERLVAGIEQRFDGVPVPRPPYWGGYRVSPLTIEFWQGRRSRLHDRLRYHRVDEAWQLERLAP